MSSNWILPDRLANHLSLLYATGYSPYDVYHSLCPRRYAALFVLSISRISVCNWRYLNMTLPVDIIRWLLASCLLASVRGYYHPAVLANDADEALLPSHYRHNRLNEAHVFALLSQSSWFGPGEQEVHQRESEQIDRSQIYNVLRHAGFIHKKNLL